MKTAGICAVREKIFEISFYDCLNTDIGVK